MHKRIGVVMYQTSTSKGQELVAQRMVRDFNALGHKAYLITSVYHDGVEAIQAKSLGKTKGYVYVEDPELGIPVVRVDSYAVKWPRSARGSGKSQWTLSCDGEQLPQSTSTNGLVDKTQRL